MPSRRGDSLRALTFVLVALVALTTLGCHRRSRARERARAAATAANAAANPVGARAYNRACAVCHGKDGLGYRADNAPALANPQFLATASDDFLRRAIVRGRPGTTMSAWDRSTGGPFDAAQVDALVRYVRAWQRWPSVALDERPVAGDVGLGRGVFAHECASCHGKEGGGGPYESLTNPEFLASVPDDYLRRVIVGGRPGTRMPAFGAKLSPMEIDALVASVRAMQSPALAPSAEAPAKVLVNPVLNPGGPEPRWKEGTEFTKVDDVKAELDRGARLVIADARPPSSYVEGHIVGAVSVPFYDVKSYLAQLPKDVWVVAYCGCPHAESGQVAAALRADGHVKATVMDEGYNPWRQRGYATKPGGKP